MTPFAPRLTADRSVGRLARTRHDDARALAEGGQDFGPADHLGEVRRADFFFALGDEHQVDGEFAARAPDGMQRGEERALRPFLVDRAAAHQHLAEIRLVDQRGVEGRRRPLGGIHLLDVVHEVEAEGAGGTCVESGEDAGLAVGGHLRDALEARVAEEAHHQVAALGHAAILGGDGGLADPVLNAAEGFVVALFDFGLDGFEVGGGCGGGYGEEEFAASGH